jgi:heme-degrading monooxygenase HmoA
LNSDDEDGPTSVCSGLTFGQPLTPTIWRAESRPIEDEKMISRIWHDWTEQGKADAYESLLKDEIFLGIKNQQIAGFLGIQLFRRNLGAEVEFITIMWFDSLEAVRAFAGEDYEAAVVPPKARALLSRFNERSQHYEVRAEMKA